MTVTTERLIGLLRSAPGSTEGLFRLLYEGLDWPLPDGLDLEEVLLDYDPTELQLDPDKVAALCSIQQVPRLTADQRFGVFLLNFEGGRLPVGAIRRLVDRLARTKRARSHGGTSPMWAAEDLLFFCQSSSTERALHVVAFRELEEKRVLKVISWSSDSTPARLDLVARRGVPDLTWADRGPSIAVDLTGHRAFTGYRQAIRSAATLATRMAEVAGDVRDEVMAMYEVETADGPIRQLYTDLQSQLIADLSPERFADVYAQTMVYGLLTARIAHPERFRQEASLAALDFENPFLDAIYNRFRQQSEDVLDIDELGLGELAEELAATDIDQVLADFGAKSQKDDPVVFFYEDFLYRYDPRQRVDLGAFFTPTPVVRFMVRTVDHAIRTHFGLAGGVADTTTWRDYVKGQPGTTPPENVALDQPVLSVVDPATGTGTFLVEWLRQVRAHSGSDGVAAALHQLSALEISLASYAVAHLKVSLELPAEARHDVRLPIYLADTLAPPRPEVFDEMADPISTEGTLADEVKYQRMHNIVIGNPPYDRVEREGTGGFIMQPGPGDRSLFDDILDPARAHTIFSHHASLYNLYVYFWRWAIWKAFEQQNGPAVVSFITASSWLSGPGFLGLRQWARELADDMWVVDLGGENKGARKEDNVFDIETPVAIVTIARRGSSDRTHPAHVRYVRIRGTREEKLGALNALDPADVGTWAAAPDSWHAALVPATGGAAWAACPLLTDLLPWQQPGAMLNRTWPVAPSKEVLARRWARFVATDDPDDRAVCFVTPKTGRNIYTSVSGLDRLVDLPTGAGHEPIEPYGMRSFDRQWTFADPRLAKTESPSLWASVSEHQVFMSSMTTGRLGQGPAATVTTAVPDKHHFRGSFGGKDVIPLYRDSSGTPNADPLLLRAVTEAHRSTRDHAPEVTVERLFTYVYGLLAGTDYTERFEEELETPGPRVPLTADPDLFSAVVAHGERLLWLHTYGERFRGPGRGAHLPAPADLAWTCPVTRMPADSNDLSYDPRSRQLRVGDGVLSGVSPEVWEFEVSGMPVVRKWLGYRTRKGAGRAAGSRSPLDAIRPEAWSDEWNDELLDLVSVLSSTLDLLPAGVALMDDVLAGPLITADDLPQPPENLRKPPKELARPGGAAQLQL
jgi:hypothetical protein